MGRFSVFLVVNATQFTLIGHMLQFGDLGLHCKAPNSITAWL